jgi:hypothetical protein
LRHILPLLQQAFISKSRKIAGLRLRGYKIEQLITQSHCLLRQMPQTSLIGIAHPNHRPKYKVARPHIRMRIREIGLLFRVWLSLFIGPVQIFGGLEGSGYCQFRPSLVTSWVSCDFITCPSWGDVANRINYVVPSLWVTYVTM